MLFVKLDETLVCLVEFFLLQIPPRGRAQQSDSKVQCYEPATMKYLGYFPALTPEEVSDTVMNVVTRIKFAEHAPSN